MGLGVAVICFKYPPKYSGYGNQMKSVIENINGINDDIIFHVLTGKFEKGSYKIINEKNIIYQLGSSFLFKIGIDFGSLLYSISLIIWLLFNQKKYSIIHCISAHSNTAIPAVLIGKLLNKRTIIKVTQAEYREIPNECNRLRKILRILRKKIVNHADYFVSISKEITKELVNSNINIEKIKEIPNGVNTNRFHSITDCKRRVLREKLNIPKDAIVILYTGALNKRKGIYVLLESIEKLTIKCELEIVLLLCGPDHENVYTSKIQNKINNIEIIYAGKVDNIEEFYQCSDIFVLPSYSEGLPNVMLEAAMCKNAIIASNIGGNRDIIEHGISGLLFSPGNAKQLKEHLTNIILSPDKRTVYSGRAYNSVINNYSIEIVTKKYIDQYMRMNNQII